MSTVETRSQRRADNRLRGAIIRVRAMKVRRREQPPMFIGLRRANIDRLEALARRSGFILLPWSLGVVLGMEIVQVGGPFHEVTL